MCTHPFAKKALTLHLVRSEGHERYFGCILMHCKVLASSHQHLMAEAPNLRVFENLAQTLVAVDALPWCTTPIEAESSLGPDSHHPIISLSGIPSAVMVLRILHPILASTLCARLVKILERPAGQQFAPSKGHLNPPSRKESRWTGRPC